MHGIDVLFFYSIMLKDGPARPAPTGLSFFSRNFLHLHPDHFGRASRKTLLATTGTIHHHSRKGRSRLASQIISTQAGEHEALFVVSAILTCLRRCFGVLGTMYFDSPAPWQDAWRELEDLYSKGAVRAIGVSNFSESLLRELLGMATVAPAAVQNWMDPFHQDRAVRALCAEHGKRDISVDLLRLSVCAYASICSEVQQDTVSLV